MMQPIEESSPFFSRKIAIQMDLDFCKAMIMARREGAEHFKIGIIVDNTPLVPAQFERAQIFSGMSSSAALCSEDISGIPTRQRARWSPQ